MPSQPNSVFSRPLSPEEHQWVRDLANHPGYQLVHQGLAELLEMEINQTLDSSNLQTVFQCQGKCKAYRQALSIPAKLLDQTQDLGEPA